MPGLMVISVEFATDHRKVAAWPRSMEMGSTVKFTMRAAGGVASGLVFVTGGGAGLGGGGGGGVCLHPAAPDQQRHGEHSCTQCSRIRSHDPCPFSGLSLGLTSIFRCPQVLLVSVWTPGIELP
jgi:hypothetical protein